MQGKQSVVEPRSGGAVARLGRAMGLKGKTIRLIDSGGLEVDSCEMPAGKNLPQAVVFGVMEAQRVFLLDKDGQYRECSYCNFPMPPIVSFSGR